MIARQVTMHFRPDKLQEFLELFNQYSLQIGRFQGCRFLNLIQDADMPNIVHTYSIWESEHHLNNYRFSELFKTVWPATKALFEQPAKAKSLHLLFSEPPFPNQ